MVLYTHIRSFTDSPELSLPLKAFCCGVGSRSTGRSPFGGRVPSAIDAAPCIAAMRICAASGLWRGPGEAVGPPSKWSMLVWLEAFIEALRMWLISRST